jgi:hypothetical protein
VLPDGYLFWVGGRNKREFICFVIYVIYLGFWEEEKKRKNAF